MQLALPHGDTGVEVGTLSAVLSLQELLAFSFGCGGEKRELARCGIRERRQQAWRCLLLRSPGRFVCCLQVHGEPTANKSLGMAGKSSPMSDGVYHIGVWMWNSQEASHFLTSSPLLVLGCCGCTQTSCLWWGRERGEGHSWPSPSLGSLYVN